MNVTQVRDDFFLNNAVVLQFCCYYLRRTVTLRCELDGAYW